jgi:hypothetical protein
MRQLLARRCSPTRAVSDLLRSDRPFRAFPELRAMAIGSSSLRTSFATSSSSSCIADLIWLSMMSTARSFRLRVASPAVRYQTLTARSWGSMLSTLVATSAGVKCVGSRTWWKADCRTRLVGQCLVR